MDLKDFTPKTDDIIIELVVGDTKLLNADDSPMTITFYSPYSKEAKSIKHSMVDDRITKAQEQEVTSLTSAEVDELNTVSLAKNIKAWHITFGGKQPKLTEKAAIELLEQAFWIKDLYHKEVEKTVGFMKG